MPRRRPKSAKKKYGGTFKTDAPLLRSATSDPVAPFALDYWEIMAAQSVHEAIEREYATRQRDDVVCQRYPELYQ